MNETTLLDDVKFAFSVGGDGTFLEHIYTIIINKTIRGSLIKKYPLIIVGQNVGQIPRKFMGAIRPESDESLVY